MSIYYKDPDGNMIETQSDNFTSPDDATDFMKSSMFAENPIGTDFDPEDYISRLRKGISEKELQKRVENGPRGMPTFSQIHEPYLRSSAGHLQHRNFNNRLIDLEYYCRTMESV